MTFVLPQVVPKAEIVPSKSVMSSSGEQCERRKQAMSKEPMAFLKTAWKEPTAEMRAKHFVAKKRVVLQLLVFSLKPMAAEKCAAGMTGEKYEKARISLQGQNHEGFQAQNSTTNADSHLLRLFLAVQANPDHILASFDISNAFLNAESSEDVVMLTQPAPELIQFGLVKPGTPYQCTKPAMVSEKSVGRSKREDIMCL